MLTEVEDVQEGILHIPQISLSSKYELYAISDTTDTTEMKFIKTQNIRFIF